MVIQYNNKTENVFDYRDIINIIHNELGEQGFLKKTMKINKFRIPEAEISEAIDIELSSGIEKYFNE